MSNIITLFDQQDIKLFFDRKTIIYQRGDYDTPVIQAKLPYPIRKSDKINTRFKIRLDI